MTEGNVARKVPLKDAVREHVEQRELSADQFDELEGLLTTSPKSSAAPVARVRRPWTWLAAAALLLSLAGFFVLSPRGGATTPDQVAAEVAKNHVKLKPLEVASSDMNEIRSFFDELDFVPVESAAFAQPDVELMGGRYCSIAGDAAAQLRVRRHADGDVGSLYMVPYEAEKHGDIPRRDRGEAPLSLYSRGLKVEIWVEQDLLMAMVATESATKP